MSDWQKTLHSSVDTLDKLAEKFGRDVIDVEALQPAFDNFQMRITPNSLDTIKEIGDPMWQQYVPTTQELDIVDGVIDSLDEDGDSPGPEHHAPLSRTACCSSSARSARATAASARGAAKSAIRKRFRSTSTTRRSSTSASTPRSATSSCRAATR